MIVIKSPFQIHANGVRIEALIAIQSIIMHTFLPCKAVIASWSYVLWIVYIDICEADAPSAVASTVVGAALKGSTGSWG
jgi:hypothetical protein